MKRLVMLFVVVLVFVFLSGTSFAYDVSVTTDKYFYATDETIYALGIVKINDTAISNVSVTFSAIRAGTTAASGTFTTNSSGQFNYTFSLSTAGNYTLLANASGDFVQHFIRVNAYKSIIMTLDKTTYSTGASGVLTINVLDVNGNGVSSQTMNPGIYYTNMTLYSSLSSCTTDSLGTCKINFTAPSTDGEYIIAVNNFEDFIGFVVGGFEPSLKITPAVGARNSAITIKVIVKSSGGSGIAAAGRQLVVTTPSGTEHTTASMTQYYDDTGTAVTGVYQNTFNTTSSEGVYSVKVTITPQGSNVTRILYGNFEIRGYSIDIIPWFGSAVYYPGSSISLGIRLRNASSNEFVSGKTSIVKPGITIYDTSNMPMTLSTDVNEFSAMSMYKLDFTIPTTSKAGTYRVYIYINDSAGSGSANGYFTIQTAKPEVMTFDKFNGSAKKEFLSGEQVAARFSARNASGYVNVRYISSYGVYDEFGNDVTSLFLNRANYTASGTSATNGWINLTTPKNGGWYILRAKLVTDAGDVVAETGFDVAVLDIMVRPITAGTGVGDTGAMGGPGYMFYFRPNDTVRFNVSVTTAQESASGKEFMGAMRGPGGPSGGMMGGGFGGLGGGSAVSGARVTVTKIINIQTEEDVTSTATITNGVTDTSGAATVSLRSAVNNQQWNGGFYIVFIQVNTTDNQTDNAEAFFEVRRYFLKIDVSAATNITASQFGFAGFNNWIIGPNDNVNISVTIIEPGTWSTVTQLGNLTISGIYYGGSPGEFIFPPKLITGTNRTMAINGTASAIINVSNTPTRSWRSGFYLVRASVNISGYVDSGEGFMMSKSFEGWAQPINPTTLQMDFTTKINENVTFQVNVFDVKNHAPAANLSVSFNKIMSFESFPPSELSYTENVSSGTTDSSGRALMTLPYPSGGWSSGDYLAVFDVTNGTVTDTIEGFFQVRPFFVELQPTRWQYANNETIIFDVTISSDPSWMRNMMGGGCPPGDPMCGGGGGGPGGPGGSPMRDVTVALNQGQDLDSDMVPDVNITSPGPGLFNISAIGTKKIQSMGCMSGNSQCPGGDTQISNFESFNCDSVNASGVAPPASLNASGPRYFCLQSSGNKTFKIQTGPAGEPAPPQNMTIYFMEYVAGSVGGSTGINATGGSEYYNATLRSIKVVTFDWQTGETVIPASAYNVTSNNEVLVGVGNITIPGTGRIKLKPNTPWNGEYFNVIAEFNVSTNSEFGSTGFAIASFIANCYRYGGWGPVASGQDVVISCQVTDPSSSGNYSQHVDIRVGRIRNTWTWQDVSNTSYTVVPSSLFTNATIGTRIFNITTANMSNGQYEAEIRFNGTAGTKTSYIWFEIKDFEPVFYSSRWTYGATDPASFIAFGYSGPNQVQVNISSPTDFIVYRYDRSTWARTQVSGITVSTNISNTTNINTISLTKSGGWDEGNYEVIMNLSRVVSGVTQSTNKVEVRSWFEVRLFNVWAWSERWSNYPTDNITIYVGAEQPGSSDAYNGTLIFNVTSMTNTRTGAVLTRGTDYTSTVNITNLANIPDYPKAARINIIPLGSGLPIGDYRITIRVMENSTGRSVDTDVWINVVSYYLSVWTDRWEYAAGENITLYYNAYKPDGTTVNLSSVAIERMDRCYQSGNIWMCEMFNISNLSYTTNMTNKIVYISTTGFGEGWYYMNVRANDTRGMTATSGTGFRIGSFSFNGFIPSPSGRDYYYINENMTFNVTGTIGVNVTNATFHYWACPFSMGGGYGSCSEQTFTINISTVLTTQNQLINLNPPANGSISSWPTEWWGGVHYDIDVYAVKDSEARSVRMYTNVRFPWIWGERITTDNWQYGPNANITSMINVYLDEAGTMPLQNANVSVYKIVRNYDTSSPIIIGSSGNWTTTYNLTNATGSARIILSPIGNFTWPLGDILILYEARYGSSVTLGGRTVYIYKPGIEIWGKINGSSIDTIPVNLTAGKVFDIIITFGNPTSTAATNTAVSLSLPVNTINTSYVVANLTTLARTINIPANGANTTYWTFNITQAGNYTGTIYITPSVAGLYPSTSSYEFRATAI